MIQHSPDCLAVPNENFANNFVDVDSDILGDTTQHAGGEDSHFNYQDSAHQESMHEVQETAHNDSAQYPYCPPPPQELGEYLLPESPEEMALSEAMAYAYENGLTADYLLNSFSISHLFGPLVQSTILSTNTNELADHTHLATLEIPDPVVPGKTETLTTNSSAVKLVAEARYIFEDKEIQEFTEQVCQPIKYILRKLELPILRTDNDRDVRLFKEQILHSNSSKALLKSIKRHRLPLYPQNIAEGEGMRLSFQARAKSKTLMKIIEEEKLSVTKANITYFVSQLKDKYSNNDKMAYLIGEIRYEKTPKMEKITPPASPKLTRSSSLPVQAALKSGDLPTPSYGSSSLLSNNFHAVEDIMLGDYQDEWSANTSPIREMLDDFIAMSPQKALLGTPRQTLEDMKVEVPLVLQEVFQKVEPLGPDAFKAFIYAKSKWGLDPEFEKAVLHDIPENDLDKPLREAADNAMQYIEQEQLQAIDAIGRVFIPITDFSIPDPEWKQLDSGRNILKWMQAREEQLFRPPSWPLNRTATSKMVWSPFANGVDISAREENMNEGVPLLKQFLDMRFDESTLTSLDFVRTKDTPATFADDDQDQKIEPQLSKKKPEIDMFGTVRKRFADSSAGGSPKRPRHAPEGLSLSYEVDIKSPALLPTDSLVASGNLLANFMAVHAPKKKVLTHSKFFASPQNAAIAPSNQKEAPNKQISPHPIQQASTGVNAPAPSIEPRTIAFTIFISIRVPRRTIRVLEGLIPDLTLLERNYDAHNTFTWQPGSVVRTEVIPPLSADADITVSPSTGLIVTSLIRVRQKPRIGMNKGMIQIRVGKASLRYEHLIVLVGGDGGKNDNLEVLSPSDSTALLELQGFVGGLECHVQVHYVGGGDMTLASWVAFFICRYSLVDRGVLAGLLEPETLWEVLLRRAGFNVFAAQAVASHFKPPSGEHSVASSAAYGLGAFMAMTRGERMRRFGHLVGEKVLERVSMAVDELWNRE